MKKIFSLFAAVLMAGSMMAETFTLDFYDASKVSSTSGTALTSSNYTDFVTVPEGVTATDIVTGISKNGTVEYGKNGGLTLGTSSTNDASVTFNLGASVVVSSVTMYAVYYESGKFYINGDLNESGSVYSTKNSTIDKVTDPCVWNFATAPSSLVITKKATNGTDNQKRLTILRMVCEYTLSGNPAVAASDVTLESDATSGEISYSISNPVAEQTLTASCTADWISNVTVDAANSKVTFATTANTGAAREATVVLTYGSITKSVTVSQKRYVLDYATLPLSVVAGQTSAQVKNLDGVNLVCDGSDYNNATHKVKFSKNTHYLQVKTNARPGVCTFSFAGLAAAGVSSFKLEGSANGTDWTFVDTIRATFAEKNDIVEVSSVNAFAEDVRYVKLSFLKMTNEVNCGLGAFSIAEYVAPVVTPLTFEVAKTAETITITPSDLTAPYYVGVLDPTKTAVWGSYKDSMKLAFHAGLVAGIESQAELAAACVTGVQTITLADYTVEGSYQVVAGAMHYDAADEAAINNFVIDSEVAFETFTVEAPAPELDFTIVYADGVVTATPNDNTVGYIMVVRDASFDAAFSTSEYTDEAFFDYIVDNVFGKTDIKTGESEFDIIEDLYWLADFDELVPGDYKAILAPCVVEGISAVRDGNIIVKNFTVEGASAVTVTVDAIAKTYTIEGTEAGSYYFLMAGLSTYSEEDFSGMFAVNASYMEPGYGPAEWYEEGGMGVYKGNGTFSLSELGFGSESPAGEYRFAFQLVAMGATEGVLVGDPIFVVFNFSPATAVENVEAAKAVKTIENGKVVIIREGVRYNAVGAKL